MNIKDVGQCFVGIDVSKAIGCNDDDILRKEVDVDLPKEDMVLLKKPGLYCFILRCKKPKTEPFMEWLV